MPPAWSPARGSPRGGGGCGGYRPQSWPRTFHGVKLQPGLPQPPRLCPCQRPCGCPTGRLPLPPQRPGRQPLSFHQLIIFTNLQPRKKVHSGLNNLGREPCGREEAWRLGSGDLGQRPLPACTPCRSLRLQTQALPSPASTTALWRKAALLSGPGRSPLCCPHALPPQALGSWPGAACNPFLSSAFC